MDFPGHFRMPVIFPRKGRPRCFIPEKNVQRAIVTALTLRLFGLKIVTPQLMWNERLSS